MLTRRKIIERLGLGVTAPLVAGLADGLIGRALGATAQRRCAVFIVLAEAIPAEGENGYMPVGLNPGKASENRKTSTWTPIDQLGITLPPMLEPLSPFRQKLVMIDGLFNNLGDVDTGHGTGYGALSGLRPGAPGPEFAGPPRGITLDQFVAQKIGRETAIPSVLVGDRDQKDGRGLAAFAAGDGQPLQHYARPSALYARLVGGKPPAGGAGGEDATRALVRTRLLDSMRDDLRRLSAALAGEERARLDTHLAAIDELDRRAQRAAAAPPLDCNALPMRPDAGAPEDRLEAMMAMGTLALRCGLTNVLAVSVGVNGGHNKYRGFRTTPDYAGHGEYPIYSASIRKLYVWLSQQLAAMLTSLGPVADSTVLTIVPSHGASFREHHSDLGRWPVFIYDGTGSLRTGARYLRLGMKERSAVDLYSTVAHAVGAPTDNFGAGGMNPVKGPIAELLVR